MITVKVCGPPRSGKTAVAKVILDALQRHGTFPHISNATADHWGDEEPIASLGHVQVVLEEVRGDERPSDEELCRKTMRSLLTLDEINWLDVEGALNETLKRFDCHLTSAQFVALTNRICESLTTLGYKKVGRRV